MKKSEFTGPDELRAEYVRADFSELVRGKYASGVALPHLVMLDPDLVEAFPTDKAVNEALRTFLSTKKALAARE